MSTTQHPSNNSTIGFARHASDVNAARYGADALLSIGQTKKAMELLNKRLPKRSFYWHRYRLDYEAALDQVNWDKTTAAELYDSLSAGKEGLDPRRANGRNYMIQIAELLRDAGMEDDLRQLVDALRSHAHDPVFNDATRAEYLQKLSGQLYKYGFDRFSREILAAVANVDSRENYFREIYANELNRGAWTEAEILGSEFTTRYPGESAQQRLARVDGAMTATTALEELRPFPDSDGVTPGSGVPVTRFRYGLHDEARSIAENRKRLYHSDYVLIGRTFFRQGRFAEPPNGFTMPFRRTLTI